MLHWAAPDRVVAAVDAVAHAAAPERVAELA
jgi:hypothetical protein